MARSAGWQMGSQAAENSSKASEGKRRDVILSEAKDRRSCFGSTTDSPGVQAV
jgi:hypothetical protein